MKVKTNDRNEIWGEEYWERMKQNCSGSVSTDSNPIVYTEDGRRSTGTKTDNSGGVIGHMPNGAPVTAMTDDEFSYLMCSVDDAALVEAGHLKEILFWLRDESKKGNYLGKDGLRALAESLLRWMNRHQKYAGDKWML